MTYIPIKPIIRLPLEAYKKLHINQKTPSVIEKLLRKSYNLTVPTLAFAATTIASAVVLIFAILANIITLPIRMVHATLASSEKGSPEAVAPKPIQFEEAHLPVLVHRATDAHTIPPHQKPLTWPILPPDVQTNSMTLDFLQEKTAIPGLFVTFWELYQSAGTAQGAQFLDENDSIIPFLFPTDHVSQLNLEAPYLSRELIEALHNPDTKIAGKYILLLTMQLKHWGLELSKDDKRIVCSDNFFVRAQAMRNNPNRELIFRQVITSLGQCGFGVLAAQLAILIDQHKEEYGLSVDMKQSLQAIYERELKYIPHDPEAGTKDYLNTFPAHNANIPARDQKFYWSLVSSVWSPQDDPKENQADANFTNWDNGNPPLLQPSDDGRWIVSDLKAPYYFCAKQEEPSSPPNTETAKNISKPTTLFTGLLGGSSTVPPFVDLSGPETTIPGTAPAPKFDKPLPLKVTDKNFPVTFERNLSKEQLPPLKRSNSWPTKLPPADQKLFADDPHKHGTNKMLRQFFAGEAAIPSSDVSLWGLFRQAGTARGFDYLEESHDVVQLILPAKQGSAYNSNAPTLSREMIEEIQTNPEKASEYLFGVLMFIQFWGGKLGPDGHIHPTDDFAERAKNVYDNTHNHKRMVRMVKSLGEVGFTNLAHEMVSFMDKHKRAFGLVKGTNHNSSFIRTSRTYLNNLQKKLNKHLSTASARVPFHLVAWKNYSYDYLKDGFASDGEGTTAEQQPKWFTTRKATPREKDPIFTSLLKWDKTSNRWHMPHLVAPRLFCTVEQQEKYEAEK